MSTYINDDTGHVFNPSSLPCPSYIKEFLNYLLAVKNLTPKTVRTYYVQLCEFLRWTQVRNSANINLDDMRELDISNIPFSVIEDITTGDIFEFLAFSDTVLGNGSAIRSLKLSALKSFFGYYTSIQPRLEDDPIVNVPQPKKEKTLPKYLTEDECVQMLTAVREHPVTKFPSRDYCMLTFMLNCGMRISELVGLNVTDIRGAVMTLRGKGRKERQVYLNDSCLSTLQEYLIDRSLIQTSDPALFISKNTSRRITDRRVRMIVEDMLMVSGLSGRGFSPHKLRHTAATLMYKNGADVLVLKEILGHESVATTQIYTHLERDAIQDAMKNSPLAAFEKTQK